MREIQRNGNDDIGEEIDWEHVYRVDSRFREVIYCQQRFHDATTSNQTAENFNFEGRWCPCGKPITPRDLGLTLYKVS